MLLPPLFRRTNDCLCSHQSTHQTPASLLMGLFLSVPFCAVCKIYTLWLMLPCLPRYSRYGSGFREKSKEVRNARERGTTNHDFSTHTIVHCPSSKGSKSRLNLLILPHLNFLRQSLPFPLSFSVYPRDSQPPARNRRRCLPGWLRRQVL